MTFVRIFRLEDPIYTSTETILEPLNKEAPKIGGIESLGTPLPRLRAPESKHARAIRCPTTSLHLALLQEVNTRRNRNCTAGTELPIFRKGFGDGRFWKSACRGHKIRGQFMSQKSGQAGPHQKPNASTQRRRCEVFIEYLANCAMEGIELDKAQTVRLKRQITLALKEGRAKDPAGSV